MSAFIKLGRKTASAARNLIASYSGAPGFHVRELLAELDAALAPSTKASKFRTSQRKQKQNTKAEKAAETARIRAEALKRANGSCECGCGTPLANLPRPPAMDHFFGRGRVPQALSNVWMLTAYCDRAKTDNHPSAAYWLEKFIAHAERHGYGSEAQRARARLYAITATRSVETFPVLKPAEGR